MNQAIGRDKISLVIRDKKAYELGEGVYFRKSDDKQVRIEVSFLPKVQYWLRFDGTKVEISKKTIDSDYERFIL